MIPLYLKLGVWESSIMLKAVRSSGPCHLTRARKDATGMRIGRSLHPEIEQGAIEVGRRDVYIHTHPQVAMSAPERDIAKIRRRLESEGWVARQGSDHIVYTHPERPGRVIVPRGRGDLPMGTARSIAKAAGWI